MTKKNEGERTVASDEVIERAERELGTATGKRKGKHEVRPDGSIAYFSELEETAAEREVADTAYERELGTPKEDS